MTQANPFTAPAAPGGGDKAPRPRDMVGSLVAYSPRIYTPAGAPGNTTGVGGSDPRDRVTADLVILWTPGPVFFGGSPEWEKDPKPHTLILQQGPARFTGVWVSSSNIVKALAPGGQPLIGRMILGRIERSTVGNLPFNLVAVDGTQDHAKAVDIWSRIQMNALPFVEPQPIAGGAPVAPNSVSYAPQPEYAPPPPAGPPPAGPPAMDSYSAFLAQQAGQQQVAAAVPQIPPPPPNWDPAVWANLPDYARAQVLQATQTPPAPAGGSTNPW